MILKIAGWAANSVDPDQTPRSAASDLGLHCMHRPVCPKTEQIGQFDSSLFDSTLLILTDAV